MMLYCRSQSKWATPVQIKQNPYLIYLIMRGWAALFHSMWLTVVLLYHTTVITSDPLQLVLIGVVLEAATFLFEIPTGIVADTFGRKRSVIIAFTITGSAFMIEGALPFLPTVLLAAFLWGVGFTFYSGANDAWIADEVGLERANQAYLRGTQISLMLALLGTAIAVPLGSIQLNLPILVSGGAQLLLALFLALFMTEAGFQPGERQQPVLKETLATFQSSLQLIQQRPVLRSILLIGVTIGLSVGGFDRLYTPHLVQNFTLPLFETVVWFGLINATQKILTIMAVEVARRRLNMTDQAQMVRVLSWMYTGTIAGNLVFALSGNFPLALAFFLFSQTLREGSKPIFMAWINQHAETRVRATVISIYWQSNALGQIFGAPVIGAIGTLVSLRVALTAAALVLSPALGLFRRNTPHPPTPSD